MLAEETLEDVGQKITLTKVNQKKILVDFI